MKIVLVYSALASGKFAYAGMEKMMVWLGNALSESNHEISVCTLYDIKANANIKENVTTIPMGIPYSSSFALRNLRLFLCVPFKLGKVLSKQSADYVISFGDSAFFPLVIVKLFLGYKLIVSERGDPNSPNGFLERLRQKLVRFANIAVFQTAGARDYYNEKLGIHVENHIIPNPVSLPTEAWEYKSKKTLLSVGRLDLRQKRQDLLIDAFNKVHKIHPDWNLIICGSGGDENTVREKIKRLGLEDVILMPGAVNNVKEHMLNAGVYLLTSDFEGIPNALLEAMSIGMPVVSTDCSPGGAALLIDNYKNGILVERGNVAEFANAINYMIENVQEARNMGLAARISMSNYSPDRIKEKWLSIFE